MESWLVNFSEKKYKFNPQRVVGKAAKLALSYSPKCYILECESVRIGENIQNEILGGKIHLC